MKIFFRVAGFFFGFGAAWTIGFLIVAVGVVL
jgi:hypothetical protein